MTLDTIRVNTFVRQYFFGELSVDTESDLHIMELSPKVSGVIRRESAEGGLMLCLTSLLFYVNLSKKENGK